MDDIFDTNNNILAIKIIVSKYNKCVSLFITISEDIKNDYLSCNSFKDYALDQYKRNKKMNFNKIKYIIMYINNCSR